jgi:branched-chain amino acid aminotransferase
MYSQRGCHLHVRPNMIGTQPTLKIEPPDSALFYIIASPVVANPATETRAIFLEATPRPKPIGVDSAESCANPMPDFVPQILAMRKGKTQCLWVVEDVNFQTAEVEHLIFDAGIMNIFFMIRHKDGSKEMVTPPLDGGVLDGVMRDCVLELARERLRPEGWTISERKISMRELEEVCTAERCLEVFGSNTATVVSTIRGIRYRNRVLNCGLSDDQETGAIARRIKTWIENIQYGDELHPWR